MSMSYEQFVICAKHFEKISNALRDGWKIYSNEDESKTLYLRKINFFSSVELNRKVLWEYHIVYSNAYCVPVLYFNVCFDSGKLLSLENLEYFIDPIFKEQFNQNKWNVLTQQEHPLTRTPFFMLHPCRTEDFTKHTINSNVNPLVTWLSSVSPMVNLKLDLQYGVEEFTFDKSNSTTCVKKYRVMKVLELYSGIGGMHFALKESTIGNQSEVITAIEISPNCNEVYKYNFPNTTLIQKNLCSLSASEVNRLNPDLVLMSPPCQPFTRQGNQKDMEDERNVSLLNFIQLLPLLTSVSYILLENVKGFEESETRKRLLAALDKSNYTYNEFLLNPRQFKICNSRTRYYLLAKRSPNGNKFKSSGIICDVSPESEKRFENYYRYHIPSTINEIIEYKSLSAEWNEYSLSNKNVDKYFAVMDIVTRDHENSCCFTGGYFRYFEGTGSILTILSKNELENFEKNVPDTDMNKTLHLRYFTPNEIARVMMFPKEFKFPEHITKKQRYKMLCNSINIYVVSFLISYLTEEFVS